MEFTAVFEIVMTAVVSILASSGFWAYFQHKHDKNDAQSEMLIGLGHDRILFLGMAYVERGYITSDEYENLNDYLYTPYKKLGGNGSADRIMKEVGNLPIHKDHPPKDKGKNYEQ